jgi:hypothetical protein
LEEEKKNFNGFEVIRKDTFEFLSDTIKSQIIINDLSYPELDLILSLNDFNETSEIEVEAVCHSYNIFKDLNEEIN